MEITKSNELTKRLFLLVLKYLPAATALCYVANTVAAYFGIVIEPLSNIGGMSLFTWLFVYLSSLVFNFCIYHRLFLWFIFADDSINISDYYWVINTNTDNILMVHSVIICMIIFSCAAIHVKQNKLII